MRTLRADLASDLLATHKELSEQIVGELRRAVIEYHTTVIGHGVRISEPEAASAGSNSISGLPSLSARSEAYVAAAFPSAALAPASRPS